MTGYDRLEKVLEKVEAGYTVYFTTYTRSIPVNKKTLARFEKAGHALFKASKNQLWTKLQRKVKPPIQCA